MTVDSLQNVTYYSRSDIGFLDSLLILSFLGPFNVSEIVVSTISLLIFDVS